MIPFSLTVSSIPLDPRFGNVGEVGSVSGTVEQLAAAGVSADVILAAAKSALKKIVDDRAEALRLSLITPGSGQAMEYQEAFNEAVQVSNALAANPSAAIDPSAFPMLAASIGTDLDPKTGALTVDLAGEARSVLAAYDAYQKAGAAIRGARLKGKAAIDAAADLAGVEAAFLAVAWPDFSTAGAAAAAPTVTPTASTAATESAPAA